MEEFTCLMYGYSRETSINEVRYLMIKKMMGDDDTFTTKLKGNPARLPPCRDSLLPHIWRVNHRLALYKGANWIISEDIQPYDEMQGWKKTSAKVLEPIWYCGPDLPPSLADLLQHTEKDLNNSSAEVIECIEQRWSRGHTLRGQGHKKKLKLRPRPRTALPRTGPLEAKDKNARGQGQKCLRPRTGMLEAKAKNQGQRLKCSPKKKKKKVLK